MFFPHICGSFRHQYLINLSKSPLNLRLNYAHSCIIYLYCSMIFQTIYKFIYYASNQMRKWVCFLLKPLKGIRYLLLNPEYLSWHSCLCCCFACVGYQFFSSFCIPRVTENYKFSVVLESHLIKTIYVKYCC